MRLTEMLPPAAAVLSAPLLPGLTNWTKAKFAGRAGPSVFQLYFDLGKLLRKGAVYSRTTTWVFRAGPAVGLAAVLVAALLVPLGNCRAPLSFRGDVVLFASLLGLARLATILAAWDTGSSFEGMGASREAFFSTLAEPAFFLAPAVLSRDASELSFSALHRAIAQASWDRSGMLLLLVGGVLTIYFLAENARIPVDDPTTHLELTMIHEAMLLDHSGPDLAFLLYGSALKFWLVAAAIVSLVVPDRTAEPAAGAVLAFSAPAAISVLLGVVESTTARLRLTRVPMLLVAASTVGGVALILKYGGFFK